MCLHLKKKVHCFAPAPHCAPSVTETRVSTDLTGHSAGYPLVD
jgi:hypothetical protein